MEKIWKILAHGRFLHIKVNLDLGLVLCDALDNYVTVFVTYNDVWPRSEKTGLRGFRPGPTKTGLYCHRRWLEA